MLFIETHLKSFSRESLGNALKYFDKNKKMVYLQELGRAWQGNKYATLIIFDWLLDFQKPATLPGDWIQDFPVPIKDIEVKDEKLFFAYDNAFNIGMRDSGNGQGPPDEYPRCKPGKHKRW